jgi:NTE family protein
MASPRTAFVLSGGSIKGCFQAGAIEYLLDAGARPTVAYGISVGALNGAFLADRAGRRKRSAGTFDPARDWPTVGQELTAFWRSKITSFSKLGRRRSPAALAEQILTADFDGLLDMRPLYRMIENEVERENLLASPLVFHAGAVSVHTGRLHYANPAATNVLDFVIASTAIPIIMPTRTIGGQAFVDGGVVDIAPLRTAFQAGAEVICCVTCQTRKAVELGGDFNPRNFISFAERLMGLVTDEIVRNDVQHALEINAMLPLDGSPAVSGPYAGKRRVKILLVEPPAPLPIDLEKFSAADVAECVEIGRAAANDALKRAEAKYGPLFS